MEKDKALIVGAINVTVQEYFKHARRADKVNRTAEAKAWRNSAEALERLAKRITSGEKIGL